MNQKWQMLLDRIDALSLRERVMLFASLLVCVLAVAELLWLSPIQKAHKALLSQMNQQSTELLRLRDDLRISSGESGPGKQMRDDLAQLKNQISQVNQEISQIPAASLDETPLSKVLIHFLRRHDGLVLLKTATLPPDPKAASEVAMTGFKRQSLELTVSGSYPELIRYVQTLERSLPALRWGLMKISSDKQPVILSLQVSLVGVKR
jgi:MSHA biogenesis protein MshJ